MRPIVHVIRAEVLSGHCPPPAVEEYNFRIVPDKYGIASLCETQHPATTTFDTGRANAVGCIVQVNVNGLRVGDILTRTISGHGCAHDRNNRQREAPAAYTRGSRSIGGPMGKVAFA